jgi:acetyltransferase-like isoleucine patch superfamily enzyme
MTTSSKTGIAGTFEVVLRRFRGVLHGIMLLPLYGFGCVCIGFAFVPAFYFHTWAVPKLLDLPTPLQYAAKGTVLGSCFFITGFTLLFLLPLVNFGLRIKLKAWRGPYYSLESIPWYIHNGATYLLRYTFLEFITPGPFSNWFYQLMGMKIGRDTVLNTTNISDPSLIELGSKVTIGGSVTIVAHYGQGGFLVLAPVKIGDGATIGLKATIMGGVTIGKRAKILPNSVVLPNTVIPDGETWGGVPAQKFNAFRRAA